MTSDSNYYRRQYLRVLSDMRDLLIREDVAVKAGDPPSSAIIHTSHRLITTASALEAAHSIYEDLNQ